MIDIESLPQLSRDAQVIVTVARNKLVAANLLPFFGLRNGGGLRRVDAQADGWTPGRAVFDEVHRFAIESEEGRARTFQALIGNDRLIGLQIKLALHRAVGPTDAHQIGPGVFAESEVNNWPG